MASNPVYVEAIVISAADVQDFTWSGLTDEGPVEISPIEMLNGQFAIPADVSRISGLDNSIKDRLVIARGTMNSGSNEVIPKYYSDTQILSCCDFRVCNHGG